MRAMNSCSSTRGSSCQWCAPRAAGRATRSTWKYLQLPAARAAATRRHPARWRSRYQTGASRAWNSPSISTAGRLTSRCPTGASRDSRCRSRCLPRTAARAAVLQQRTSSSATAAAPPAAGRGKPDANKYGNLHIPPFRGGPNATANPNSVAGKNADWQPAGSLFAMGPSEGFGREAGDFHIGQLVQVSRSDGSWTYGKIMDYDPTADTYSVMTRAGPKHCIERDDITDDIVVNPSDGSCAQQ